MLSLGERLSAAAVAVAVITSAVVVAIGAVARDGFGPIAAFVVGASLAAGLSAVGLRRFVLTPLREQVSDLARIVRGEEPATTADPEFRALLQALRDRPARAEPEEGARVSVENEILDTSPFASAVIDDEGRIALVNPTFRRMFRLRAEPIGRRPIEVVPAAEVHEAVEEALAGRASERAFATAASDLVARAQPLSGGRAIVRVEDVTGIREAERARTAFVANVTHELRTPMAAILGYLEMIRDEEERIPEDLRGLLDTVERNAQRLRDLFEDLLKLHRIEARRREFPLERRKLRELLEKAVGPARDRAHMRRQELIVRCEPDLEGLVNPDAFTAIIGNLVGNASAYSTEGGHIEVRAASEGNGVRVDVQDDGIGIAERHHERIFERFYRVDEARSRRIGGTGLGLAIVKHYALASRCHVSLKSREGEGSTFTLHLPAGEQP